MHSVSVIIPVFNRYFFLERAVLSVLYQEEFRGEIIIVDDGSTDKTPALIEQLQKCNPEKIRTFRQKQAGPAAARNHGIHMAKFPLIAFLDSDDHWHKKKLRLQVALLKSNPKYLISHTQEKWLRNGEHLNKKKKHHPRHGNIFDHCLQLCAVGMSTVLVRKELFDIVGMFDETLPCCEDYDFWLRVSCRFPFLLLEEQMTIKEGGRDDQVSYLYRVGMDRFRIDAMVNLLDSNVLTFEQREITLKELRKKCTVFGNGCIKHGKQELGKSYLSIIDQYDSQLNIKSL
jgi:glycosyltransferase involved in cell wall biosynthesis